MSLVVVHLICSRNWCWWMTSAMIVSCSNNLYGNAWMHWYPIWCACVWCVSVCTNILSNARNSVFVYLWQCSVIPLSLPLPPFPYLFCLVQDGELLAAISKVRVIRLQRRQGVYQHWHTCTISLQHALLEPITLYSSVNRKNVCSCYVTASSFLLAYVNKQEMCVEIL